MGKIISFNEGDLDKVWYNSSNIVYSECDDIEDKLKVVRITFKDGRTYQYSDVKVNDYLLFREDASQGKALNRIMKNYPCERLESIDVTSIQNELKLILECFAQSEETGEDVINLINEKKKNKE